MPAEYSKTVLSVIIRTFLVWSGEKGRRMTIGKFDLIYSLSLLYPVHMKMQLSFFCRKRIFLKKKAGYGCTFHFRPIVFVQGFGKNALGN